MEASQTGSTQQRNGDQPVSFRERQGSSTTKRKMTWKERLLKKDDTFTKYVESTTAHGVVRIFTGKSIIRRLFWLVIVLTAAGGCLYNISDRIRYLISSPTSTTVSITRQSELTFPAVTVCNLNFFRRSVLDERNLTDLVQSAIILQDSLGLEGCDSFVDSFSTTEVYTPLRETTYEELTQVARNILEDFIIDCYFAGEQCNVSESFDPVFTSLGLCYTFNAGRHGKSIMKSSGTGQRHGLQVMINVDQLDYSVPLDAGVKVAIHPQSEPSLPDDQGIGIPTGRNAFISVREKRIQDQTGRGCNSETDVSNLNFLQGEYAVYTEAACLVDCLHSSIADDCGCIAARSFYVPDNSTYSTLPNCTLESVCCIVDELLIPDVCNCPAACSSVLYESSLSYSYFPADHVSISLGSLFNSSPAIFPSNLLQMNVYFETLNIETQTTNNAYSFVALLSDIGGQLGLFLGVSVISIMEFATWLVDEIKNRFLGVNEQKVKKMCCTCPCCKHFLSQTKPASFASDTSCEKDSSTAL